MSSSGIPFTRSKKTKPSPPPQPADHEYTDSSSSEEEKEKEIPPPPPPQSEQHYEDAEEPSKNTEEESDDENTEEDQDGDPDSVTQLKQITQMTVVEPSLDGECQLVLGTSSPLAPRSNRIWQDSMQLVLLREMVEYSKINGKCKVSFSYISKFHSSLKSSHLHKFSVNQILEKMKRFKKKYDNPYGKGKTKVNPLNPELLELSRKLWGEAGKGKGRKRKRVKVEAVENDGDDNVNDDDEGDDSVNETTVWENAMVRLMEEEFYYQENYTRQKIASLDKSTRNLLEKRWLNRKGKLNSAILNFGRVENDCLKALLRS